MEMLTPILSEMQFTEHYHDGNVRIAKLLKLEYYAWRVLYFSPKGDILVR